MVVVVIVAVMALLVKVLSCIGRSCDLLGTSNLSV